MGAKVKTTAGENQRKDHRPTPKATVIPAWSIEADYETQQIKSEWKGPQKRNNGHLLTDLCGGCHQQQRRDKGEQQPEGHESHSSHPLQNGDFNDAGRLLHILMRLHTG